MASKKMSSWQGQSFPPTTTHSISAVAEFLSSIVHINVDAEMLHDFTSVRSAMQLLTVLMDLCLLARSGWPAHPKERLPGLWEKIAEEFGRARLAQTGIEMIKEQLERLDYPQAFRFEHKNPHHLLSGVAWVLARCVMDVYSRSKPVSTTVPPLPYNVLGLAFKEASPSTHSTHGTAPAASSWQHVSELTHKAQRLHGRIDILQKQLQQELVRNAKITRKLESACEDAKLLRTPYELSAANSEVLQVHMDDVSAMCQELDTRQKLSQLAPGFFEWVCMVVSPDEQLQQPHNHTLLLPDHLRDADVSQLQAALERQAAAAEAALRNVQSIIASDYPGPSQVGLPAPVVALPAIPTLEGIVASIQQHVACDDIRQGHNSLEDEKPATSLKPPGLSSRPSELSHLQQPCNCAITMQGSMARTRYADLLKVSDFRSGPEDAALMQALCLKIARHVARVRVRLKMQINSAVEGIERIQLLGM